jgi:uncharacterized membrane protein
MVHEFLVTGLKTATLLAGAAITYFAYRAYDRTGAPALRALTVGFGTVTLGSLIAGAVDLLLPVARDTALLVESGLTLVGFLVVLYSLYAE